MVRSEIYVAAVIVGAFLPPLAVAIGLAKWGKKEWAKKALVQAVRWIVAGIWIGIILRGAREWGSLGALVLAMFAAVALTVAEYSFLCFESEPGDDGGEAQG